MVRAPALQAGGRRFESVILHNSYKRGGLFFLPIKFIHIVFFDNCSLRFYIEIRDGMNYKEQLQEWIEKHPDATLQEAFTAGWMLCTDAWCHGKREKMEQVCELMKEIIQ